MKKEIDLRQQAVKLAGDEGLMFLDGFDTAIVGTATIGNNFVALYDKDIIINILMHEGMSEEDAEDHFAYNIAGSHIGDQTPAIARFFTSKPMSKHDKAYIKKFQPMEVTNEQIAELLKKLIDNGPLWYRGSMPEEGAATVIIRQWIEKNHIIVEVKR